MTARLILGFCLAVPLAIGACSEVPQPTGQPLSGTSAGPAAPLAQREATGIGGRNSPDGSAGVASFVGTQGGARPTFAYQGDPDAAANAGIGGATTPAPPFRSGSRHN